MRRGSNLPVTIAFSDLDPSTIDKLNIAFSQDHKVIFEKTEADCVFMNEYLIIQMTVEDTLKLMPGHRVFFQVRARFKNGTEDSTNIMFDMVEGILKDGDL